jgi:predicted nucleic acid-binding Zn ribbon protein
MNKQAILEQLKTNSIRSAAKNLNTSFTNLRYWIKTYEIVVGPIHTTCEVCGKEVTNDRNSKLRKVCSNKCRAVRYGANKYRKNLRFRRKAHAIKFLGGKCTSCGYCKNLSALDIHHIDPSQKEFQLNSTKLGGSDWSTVEKELKKCTVLCKNCHAEHHNPQHTDWISTEDRW